MRFQQALLLQKQQAEQQEEREEWQKRFGPIVEKVVREFEGVKAFYDPIQLSYQRCLKKLELANHQTAPSRNEVNNAPDLRRSHSQQPISSLRNRWSTVDGNASPSSDRGGRSPRPGTRMAKVRRQTEVTSPSQRRASAT